MTSYPDPSGQPRPESWLDALPPGAESAASQLGSLAEAVAHARRTFRVLSVEQWRLALPLSAAALEQARLATGGRLSLDGRPESELFRDVLARSIDPGTAAEGLASHSDVELFLGFCGEASSRSHTARWEISGRGAALVQEIAGRICRAAPAVAVRSEAVHWGMTLLDRVRRREVEPDYLELAISLIRSSGVPDVSLLLYGYLERQDRAGAWLLECPAIQQALTGNDVERVQATRLTAAIELAVETADVQDVLEICASCKATGVRFRLPTLGRTRVAAVAAAMRQGMPASTLGRAMAETADALISVLASEAHADVRDIFAETGSSTPAASRGRFHRAAVLGGVALTALLIAGLSRLIDRTDGVELLVHTRAFLAIPSGLLARPSPPDAEVITARLARAEDHAADQQWSAVVEVLRDRPHGDFRQAFRWDSMLAVGAFRHAMALARNDPSRATMYSLSLEGSTRALEEIGAFGPAADELRLLRAQACLSADLNCAEEAIRRDLVLAARSPSSTVSNQAVLLLGESVR